MTINKDVLRNDGFNDSEIEWLEKHCSDEKKKGRFSNKAAAVSLRGGPIKLVCETVARAVNELRPGAWIPIR